MYNAYLFLLLQKVTLNCGLRELLRCAKHNTAECLNALGSPAPPQGGQGPVGVNPGENHEENWGIEQLLCEERLRELGLFS